MIIYVWGCDSTFEMKRIFVLMYRLRVCVSPYQEMPVLSQYMSSSLWGLGREYQPLEPDLAPCDQAFTTRGLCGKVVNDNDMFPEHPRAAHRKGLVTNYGEGGGLQNGRGGGHMKFFPYKKGGGHKKCWSRFYAVA